MSALNEFMAKDDEIREQYLSGRQYLDRLQKKVDDYAPPKDPVLDPDTLQYVAGTPKAKQKFKAFMDKLEAKAKGS